MEFMYSDTSGAIVYTIKDLQPGTEYFFKVRAGNHSATGPWGSVKSAKTDSASIIDRFTSLPPISFGFGDSDEQTSETEEGQKDKGKDQTEDKNQDKGKADETKNDKDIVGEDDDKQGSVEGKSWWERLIDWFIEAVDWVKEKVSPSPTPTPEPPTLIEEPIESPDPTPEPTEDPDAGTIEIPLEATDSADLSDEEATESAESTESASIIEPISDEEEPPATGGVVERIADAIVSSPPASIIRETAQAIEQTPAVKSAQQTIAVLREEPAAQAAAVVGTGAVVTTAAISTSLITLDRTVKVAQASVTVFKTASAFAGSGLGLAALMQYLISVFTNIVPIAFIDRRKKKTLGVVLDTEKRLGLSAAYVMFFTKDGQLKTAVTNQSGRYSLKLDTGNYQVNAEKPGFEMADAADLRVLEKEYATVYYPSTELPYKESSFANVAIGLRERVSASSGVKALSGLSSFISRFISRHYPILITISFLITFSGQLINPNPINLAMLYLILISVMLKLSQKVLDGKGYGVIKDSDGQTIAGIRVELHQHENGSAQFYSATQTDEIGRYQFAPENGTYTIKAISKQGQILYTKTIQVTDKFPVVNTAFMLNI